MNHDLFGTKEKAEAGIAAFRELKSTRGWLLVSEIVNINIKVLEDQILNGIENETKEQIDRKRDKLRAYKEIIGTPDYWIEKLEQPKKAVVNDGDPYITAGDLEKK